MPLIRPEDMVLIRKCCTPVKAALVSEGWGRRLLGCLIASVWEREKKWYRHIGPRAKILSHSVCMTHVLKLFKHAHTRKQLFMPPLFTLPWPKCPYNISIIIFCLNPKKKRQYALRYYYVLFVTICVKQEYTAGTHTCSLSQQNVHFCSWKMT